jgi:hypothetical protein
VQVLDEPTWRERRAAHEARVDVWIAPHLARRSGGRKHPVHDFLFTYYAHRPARLRRWHPGFGVGLAGDTDLAGRRGYSSDSPVTVTRAFALAQRPAITAVRRLLAATAGRPAMFGCFGLHEWAMVYRTGSTRHDWPLRLGAAGTDEVVRGHRLACTHFDAYRFFTSAALPRNGLVPDRARTEQPGCLHAGMDLYKHAFRLTPFVSSELVADCFALAREIRELDMRASPYDLSDLGYVPIPIETAEGKQQYVSAQRVFSERAEPLRARLIAECDNLL